ncbi:MAG: FlgN protein [Chlamydiales bacterium]|jgi:flagellar biosynthesis/type III secretory pathway chaperone|nr:FlgN protein [Chlamydiales bacterium]
MEIDKDRYIDPEKEQSDIVKSAQKRLQELMQREIAVMREMLSSMQREQDSLLLNNVNVLQMIMKDREAIFETLMSIRNERIEEVKLVATLLYKAKGYPPNNDGQEKKLEDLLDPTSSETCEIFLLRDQLLALLEKINEQNSRNNRLIQNRIRNTKELMRRLYPNELGPVYQGDGKYAQKTKITTMTLINHEG